jgi:hypothetical protein
VAPLGGRRAAIGALADFLAFGLVVSRRVGDVGADRHMLGAEFLDGVVEVVEEAR